MTRIKICGIKNVADALYCAEAGADAVGLVFAHSPRQIDVATAQKICAALPPFISRIGVFVDTDIESVERISQTCGLTALQFHGNEDEQYCQSFTLPVLKAIRVKQAEDLNGLAGHPASAVVLDTFHPTLAGGTGEPFDWNLAQTALPKPVILAGGLTPQNVQAAIGKLKPYAVDVSSGVETNGAKDRDKIKAFIDQVRRCA
ncbi:phosphoribosylanthranilate isomerase [Dethiobacter alkaliphilus]|uniref:N-(5'-phosphoribosyl)anthranilate isomerase n=1 Tax=Dethiobacter alkaliphilus AHT 1 TaxID=555088 RepID=C0GDL0_DETAL|nr:phosphoribosylanthranilate isomerase [Dethiobacter alkaliphilus]EEG78493.1 Phosphoribosylanthranilate isomerase [Dethiobacter alkaliphilus AHT 1]